MEYQLVVGAAAQDLGYRASTADELARGEDRRGQQAHPDCAPGA
jgi:hypothetical protein